MKYATDVQRKSWKRGYMGGHGDGQSANRQQIRGNSRACQLNTLRSNYAPW